MTYTNEQRAMMAAHLCEIIPAMMRDGRDPVFVIEHLHELARRSMDPEYNYVEGLINAGWNVTDINAAVADIAAGRHPATSVVGQIEKFCADVSRLAQDERMGGKLAATQWVLDLLGIEVKP